MPTGNQIKRDPYEEFRSLPGRVFLDTNVVNLFVKFGNYVFEGWTSDEEAEELRLRGPMDRADVEALHNIVLINRRAFFELVVSPSVIEEVSKTTDPSLCRRLLDYALELKVYGEELRRQRYRSASWQTTVLSRGTLRASAKALGFIPERQDRKLLLECFTYGCDAFLTSDRSTILKYKENLAKIGLVTLSPSEWWEMLRPWAAIWY